MVTCIEASAPTATAPNSLVTLLFILGVCYYVINFCFGAAKLAVSHGLVFFSSSISSFILVQKFVKIAKLHKNNSKKCKKNPPSVQKPWTNGGILSLRAVSVIRGIEPSHRPLSLPPDQPPRRSFRSCRHR